MEEKTQNFRMGQLDNLPDEEEEEEEEEEPPQAPDELEGYGEDDSDKVTNPLYNTCHYTLHVICNKADRCQIDATLEYEYMTAT